ncbi:DUF805 domain-containing protein [Chitinimonas sp. BJYL2]|uniref:DUF805 domain-containing protein n=1 Tax=Chitinimonas sp. BJYL2 TaxID=2976696 RepID=UPI0022B49CC0|nr:DUF805 domain-containing protein [Chitinimonas sp. BJYL2]
MQDELNVSAPVPAEAIKPAKRRIPWPSGRIGRVRYISIVLGLVVVYSALLSLTGLLLTLSGVSPVVAERTLQLFSAVLFVPLMGAILFWSIERVHDMGLSGWVALVVFVPYVNLLFWLWPGKREANAYGPQPTSASLLLRMLVLMVVAILVLIYATTLWYGPIMPEQPGPPPTDLPIYRE